MLVAFVFTRCSEHNSFIIIIIIIIIIVRTAQVEHLYYFACALPSLLLLTTPFALLWNGVRLAQPRAW